MPITETRQQLPPYLSIRDIAELLNVHPRTINRLINKKVIPAKKVGGTFRVSREDFEAYMKEH